MLGFHGPGQNLSIAQWPKFIKLRFCNGNAQLAKIRPELSVPVKVFVASMVQVKIPPGYSVARVSDALGTLHIPATTKLLYP